MLFKMESSFRTAMAAYSADLGVVIKLAFWSFRRFFAWKFKESFVR